jgi:hypothetical protein
MVLDGIHDDLVRTLGNDAVAYSTVTKYARSAQFSGRKEPPLSKLQMWNAVLSTRKTHGSCRISVFVCTPAFAEGLSSEIHRAPAPAPHAITSIHSATSSMGPPLCDSGTEADSGPDGNQTIAGPLGAKHASVAQHCRLGRVVDLFVQ